MLRWEVISEGAPPVNAVLEVKELSSEGGDEAVTADKAIAHTTRLTARSAANREPLLPRNDLRGFRLPLYTR
jgi:hypothetical protein